VEQPTLRVVRMSGPALTEGIEPIEIDGVQVPVFNASKTVADCFKFRNKIGLDVALEALRDSWAQRKLTMDPLWHYAAVNRVANVMRTLPGKRCGVMFHRYTRPAHLHTLELAGQLMDARPSGLVVFLVVSLTSDHGKMRIHKACSP
jgi:hypothetical protein